jgi:hypothetical protein
MQIASLILWGACCWGQTNLEPVPETARLVIDEDWSNGRIDPEKWYVLRKQWGAGNHGVVPENVRIEQDTVHGRRQNVLVCTARGDRYTGPVKGLGGNSTRVGGVIVSKPFLASGRYEVVMKIGSAHPHAGGPANPAHPRGTVPAIWTYGYRFVQVDRALQDQFVPDTPLYNPHMKAYGMGANEYVSELDFPEFGKAGDFSKGLYNTFCQNRHESRTFDVSAASDGKYHTFTTEWRTRLEPLPGITDAQVAQFLGYWWICDRTVPFERYLGNPLKRLDRDSYALYTGERAVHWIDGQQVGENRRYVPAMAAQLNLGIWLPEWAGPAPWETAEVRFASVRVWQYDDPGDVRGVLVDDIDDNFRPDGQRLR